MSENTFSNDTSWIGKTLITFFSIISIRIFFDSFAYSVGFDQVFLWEHYIHGLLYFSSIFLSFSLLLFSLTKLSFKTILNFLAKVSTVILIVPFVDILVSKTKLTPLYITVDFSNIVQTFLRMMNPLSAKGVTVGIYVAAYITLGLFFYFVFQNTRDIKKAIASMFLGYVIFFTYSILPSFILIFSNYAHELTTSLAYSLIIKSSWVAKELSTTNLDLFFEYIMARVFWLSIILQTGAILFLSNQRIWNALKKYLRLERIVNYCLIATIGIIINQQLFGFIGISNPINFLTLICLFLMIAFDAWLAVLINDPEDIMIDKISNPDRPLVNGTLSIHEWELVKKFVFIIFLLGLLILNRNSAFLLVLAQCAFYVYSAKPLRLKRNFLFSSAIIGFTTIVVAMSGFYAVSPDKPLSAFPLKAIWMIGLAYALLSNIKDIKDYEGDKKAHIKTIPVAFGLIQSKKIIALLYALVFISIPFFLSIPQLYLFALSASAFCYFILTRSYHEKYIFYMKFAYMAMLFYFFK